MKFEMNLHHLHNEFKNACKNIRQANKGLPAKVIICKDWKLIKKENQNWITMQIFYIDGNGKPETYNIAAI